MQDGGWALLDWHLVRGNTIPPLDIVWKQDADTPVDLAGWGVDLAIRWAGGEIRLEPGSGLSVIWSEGRVTVELNHDQAYSLPAGRLAQYELMLTRPSGARLTKLKGFLIVTDTLF